MNRRLLITLVLTLMSLFYASGSYAAKGLTGSRGQIVTYYGKPISGAKGTVTVNMATTTKGGVFHGIWDLFSRDPNGYMTVTSWDGNASGFSPVRLKLASEQAVSTGCAGMDKTRWTCMKVFIDIEVTWQDSEACPWILMFITRSTDTSTGDSWTSTMERTSGCNYVPATGLDISWDRDVIQHDKQITLNSTGGTMETTLHTYLWEGGSFCDNSAMTERGAYCRMITTGVSISAIGCNNEKLTTSVVRHPLMDQIVHDIILRINLEHVGGGQFISTCNYRYVIDQL